MLRFLVYKRITAADNALLSTTECIAATSFVRCGWREKYEKM